METKKKTAQAESVKVDTPSQGKRRPLHTVRNDDVSASIWPREVQFENGSTTFYSVSIERSYVDKKGERRYTSFFDADSLGRVVTAVKAAAEKIAELQQAAEVQ